MIPTVMLLAYTSVRVEDEASRALTQSFTVTGSKTFKTQQAPEAEASKDNEY